MLYRSQKFLSFLDLRPVVSGGSVRRKMAKMPSELFTVLANKGYVKNFFRSEMRELILLTISRKTWISRSDWAQAIEYLPIVGQRIEFKDIAPSSLLLAPLHGCFLTVPQAQKVRSSVLY